ELLILDEPTSGVDPVARDNFWRILIELARRDNVTIFVSTHFMNEAELCDRISLMHAGRVLVSDRPAALVAQLGVETLEDAFIASRENAVKEAASQPAGVVQTGPAAPRPAAEEGRPAPKGRGLVALRRLFSYARRDALELGREPIRLVTATLGS